MKIKISTGNINDCLKISGNIPEFSDKKYDITHYKQRLDKAFHLILIAYDNNEPVAFKVAMIEMKMEHFIAGWVE